LVVGKPHTSSWLRLLVLVALAVLCWIPSDLALADTFNVTKTLDTRDGKCDADCSLREAIIAANQHPGSDTVMVPAGKYLLQRVGQEDQAAAGDLDILDDLALIGAGAERTLIDGGQIDRVFEIHNPAVVRLSGLTIQNGSTYQSGGFNYSGGGIYNNGGTLTLENCTLSGNSVYHGANGGGIDNSGTATLTNCTLSGNLVTQGGGAAIYNQAGGTLTLENSILSGNSAGGGGGGAISNYGGTATLINSTLSSNSANVQREFGNGGGIYNQAGGTLTLENSTLSSNSAIGGNGGGIYNSNFSAAATLINCTLSCNSAYAGGGIYNQTGTVMLENCTLSGNSARDNGSDAIGGGATLENTILANSPRGRNCSAPLQSNGHNLDDGDGGCGFSNTGDLSVVPANLAPLGNYGGPTQTHALCTGFAQPHPDCTAGSPAIDAGANAHCPATDQRGAPRPHGSACDIGAYESGAQPPSVGTCIGDCNNDHSVTVNELVTLVNIALGNAEPATCPNGVPADAEVDIALIIQAVNNTLDGCGGG
jgi:CSLREA domain-containing protein